MMITGKGTTGKGTTGKGTTGKDYRLIKNNFFYFLYHVFFFSKRFTKQHKRKLQ